MLYKRILFGVMFLSLLIGSAGLGTGNVHAQESDPNELVTFTMLGQTEIAMKGPAASTTVDFTLPADWEMTDGSELHLNVHVYSGQEDTGLPGNKRAVEGYLSVWLNDTWLQTVTFNQEGDYSFVIPIQPLSAWVTNPRNALQSVRFYLEDAQTCEMIQAALQNGIVSGINIVIQPTSYLVMPHTSASVPLDLRLFPYPIYQATFLPEKAVLVMPSQPTEGELQAAFTVASVMGKLTGGKLPMTFTTADLLNAAALDDSQMIFVGKPSSFPQLAEASLPIPFNGTSFDDAQIAEEDGVLQLFASPRNPALSWLLVSGATETAIIKAAQALGSSTILPGASPNLAIVSSVQAQPQKTDSYDTTLRDLGYGSLTLTGYGDRYATYWINVPADYKVSEGAYFDLIFANSALMNYEESGLIININDFFVGGIRYSDRTSTTTTYRFPLPAEALRTGENLLIVQSSQHATTPCVAYTDIWLSISADSQFYIPIEPATESPVTYDLGSYPVPLFAYFSNTAYIVAREDPVGWSAAASIAYDLGITPRGSLINPIVVYGDSVPNDVRQNYDLLIVGRASTLPIVGDLASALPAPFETGQDIALNPETEVTFKVPSSSPVGYIQTLASPWNNRRGILLVAGNSPDGVQSAAAALVTPTLRGQLDGNFAIVTGNQIITSMIDVQQQTIDIAPTVTPAADTAAETTQVFNVNFVAIGIIIVGLLVILGVVYWLITHRNGKRKSAAHAAGSKKKGKGGEEESKGKTGEGESQ